MSRLKFCYFKSLGNTNLLQNVFIHIIFTYVSTIMIYTSVTVSKIVQTHLGNIITGLSPNETASQVHSEVLQVEMSPKQNVRDRTMKNLK